jgi:nucleotide-binding universal stress UspA family protein
MLGRRARKGSAWARWPTRAAHAASGMPRDRPRRAAGAAFGARPRGTVGRSPVAASAPDGAGRDVAAVRRLEEELRPQLIASEMEIELRNGSPSRCILATAAERNAALIVLGCRGAGSVRAAIFGSVTDQIVRKARCPMVIVPPAMAKTGTIRLTGTGVVCGVQRFGDLACARVAQELARELDVRFVLAHVLPRSADVAALTPAGVIRAGFEGRGTTREQAALSALGRVHEELARNDVAHLRVRRGSPGRQLAELAVAEDAMLVVTGARRWRGPLRAAVLGSVSRRLARTGQRPAVICPQKGHLGTGRRGAACLPRPSREDPPGDEGEHSGVRAPPWRAGQRREARRVTVEAGEPADEQGSGDRHRHEAAGARNQEAGELLVGERAEAQDGRPQQPPVWRRTSVRRRAESLSSRARAGSRRAERRRGRSAPAGTGT